MYTFLWVLINAYLGNSALDCGMNQSSLIPPTDPDPQSRSLWYHAFLPSLTPGSHVSVPSLYRFAFSRCHIMESYTLEPSESGLTLANAFKMYLCHYVYSVLFPCNCSIALSCRGHYSLWTSWGISGVFTVWGMWIKLLWTLPYMFLWGYKLFLLDK